MADDIRTVLHWYDFLCPFCYVGQHRTAILVRHGLAVVELPFQAHPDIPRGGIPAGYAAGRCTQCSNTRPRTPGLPLHRPAHLPNTRRALAAAEWARRHEPLAFPPFRGALLSVISCLVKISKMQPVIDQHAREAGIGLAALRGVLAHDNAAAAVDEVEVVGRSMVFRERRLG